MYAVEHVFNFLLSDEPRGALHSQKVECTFNYQAWHAYGYSLCT